MSNLLPPNFVLSEDGYFGVEKETIEPYLALDETDGNVGKESADQLNNTTRLENISGNGGDDGINIKWFEPNDDGSVYYLQDSRRYVNIYSSAPRIYRGGSGDDLIGGSNRDDELYGDEGDDILFSGMGPDLLSGGLGADRLFGGAGDDIYYITADRLVDGVGISDDLIFEAEPHGRDTIVTTISYSMATASNVEQLFAIVESELDMELTGNDINNVIAPSLGNNTVDGADGIDVAWYDRYFGYEEVFIFRKDDVIKVRKSNGSIDTLVNIEKISFSDYLYLADDPLIKEIAPLTISTASSMYDEGSNITFTLSKSEAATGAELGYTITGITADDLDGASLKGSFVIDNLGGSTSSIAIYDDQLTEGDEVLTITLDSEPSTTLSLTILDTSITPTYSEVTYSSTLLVDEGVIAEIAYFVPGLVETVERKDGEVVSHTFSYEGQVYNYADIRPLAMVVIRDNEFSEEFSQEIAEYAPTAAGISLEDMIKIVGEANLYSVMGYIASADGSFIY